MKTVADRVVIKPYPSQDKIGSIFVQESRKRPQKGKLLGVGPDTKVAIEGSEVLYQAGAGVEVEIDGENIIFMRESDLLAVL